MNKQEYNKVPVLTCKNCLSLKIKCEDATEEFTEGISTDELQYCADCGGTDIVTMSFNRWQSLYEETTGLIYLELK